MEGASTPNVGGEGKASWKKSHLIRAWAGYILEMSQEVKSLPDPKYNLRTVHSNSQHE